MNLSHASCFRLFCTFHLDLLHFYLVCLLVLHVQRNCCNGHFQFVSITALLQLMITVCLNFSSWHMSKPSEVTLVVCEVLNLCVYVCMLCILSVRVCERQRDEVQDMRTHTSPSHPLCLLLSLSISCSYQADFITLLAAGRLPVTNWDG